jgi:hypothetical protein
METLDSVIDGVVRFFFDLFGTRGLFVWLLICAAFAGGLGVMLIHKWITYWRYQGEKASLNMGLGFVGLGLFAVYWVMNRW